MDFLELRQEPGVYSQVTAGMSIRNSSLFIEVRNLSRYEGQLRNVNSFFHVFISHQYVFFGEMSI